MRIVALSATFSNLEDVAAWIDCKMEHCHYFSDDFRPVPLQTMVIAYGSSKNPFLFDKSLDNHVSSVIRRYNDGKQTLIFCPSKNSAETLAAKLCNQLSIPMNRNDLIDTICKIEDDRIRECILKGSCAYHHAGLLPGDRHIIESLFLSGVIAVLCSTTTLAHGVNLPAHLVVIKGTNSWRGSGVGYERTKRSDILQMLGRAGRPGFDSFGVAVIMTSNEERSFYENIASNTEIVESNMLSGIIEGWSISMHRFV
jgi:ATP-dependent DNA helicase HFM1/MER3